MRVNKHSKDCKESSYFVVTKFFRLTRASSFIHVPMLMRDAGRRSGHAQGSNTASEAERRNNGGMQEGKKMTRRCLCEIYINRKKKRRLLTGWC
uniref:Uncharacterized protein n=1 Tax=Arundo donax TaxID=35708 RepID=A0A0A9CZD5_ARUDO